MSCPHNWELRGTAWLRRDREVNVYKCSLCKTTQHRDKGDANPAIPDRTKGDYNHVGPWNG